MGCLRRRKNKGKTVWAIDIYVDGKRHRRTIGPDKTEAERVLREAEREVREKKFPALEGWQRPRKKVYVSEIFDDFWEYSKVNKRSAERDAVCLKHFRQFFGSLSVNRVVPKEIERYKAIRREKVRPATVNRELTCLKTVFNLAIKNGKAITNPVRQIKMFLDPAKRIRFLTQDETRLLMGACDDKLRPLVIIALHTGMRRGEILNLRWGDIDFDNRLLWVGETKTGEGRYIPMNETVINMLNKRQDKTQDKLLFAKNEYPRWTVRRRFNRVTKKTAITGCTFHTLRHTFASHLVMAGVDLVTVGELLDHKNYTTTLRYAHLAPEHKRGAMLKLENWRRGKMVTNRSKGEISI